MTTLVSLYSEFTNLFQLTSNSDEDNLVFKIISKFSVGLCVLATLILAADSYAGDAIHCAHVFNKMELVEQFCWVHGTKHIDPQHIKSINEAYRLQPQNSPICEANIVSSFNSFGSIISRIKL